VFDDVEILAVYFKCAIGETGRFYMAATRAASWWMAMDKSVDRG